MIRTTSLERVVVVARALENIPEPFLFVGASVLGLLATEKQAPTPRATQDVDVVALVVDLAQRVALDERLRQRGFSEDVESGVICRWRYRGYIVDVMPSDPRVLGFSNELYPSALAHVANTEVDGVVIRHIDAPHFIGTKLLAFEGRGKDDLFGSHDLEDLIAVINSRPEVVTEIAQAPLACLAVILPKIHKLRGRPLFAEALEGHLANDVAGQDAIVLTRIDAILGAE